MNTTITWIKLHVSGTNEEVYINTDKIVAIRKEDTGTVIELPGTDNYYYIVKESVKEVFKQMAELAIDASSLSTLGKLFGI